MLCQYRGWWLLFIAAFAIAFVIGFRTGSKAAVRTDGPSIYFVDFTEATYCGQNAVYAAGEEEIALVFTTGSLSDVLQPDCRRNDFDPSIGVYVYAEASIGKGGTIRLDGLPFDKLFFPQAMRSQIRNGDLVMVRLNSAGPVIEPVYARHIGGHEYMTTLRGKRAVEIYRDYRRAAVESVTAIREGN